MPAIHRPDQASSPTESQGERLFIVSNRLPSKGAAGGLGTALGTAMEKNGGVWLGWSGEITEDKDSGQVLHTAQLGRTELVSVNLSQRDYDDYYLGVNEGLWPTFHDMTELAIFKDEYFEGYERVNKMFASKLFPMLRDGDIVWIHDYHLILLAEELRRLNFERERSGTQPIDFRIGFFSHIPFPKPDSLVKIPQHERLMSAFCTYDLVGMQVQNDVKNFHQYMELHANGERLDDQRVKAFGKTVFTRHFPIGIDASQFSKLGASMTDRNDIMEMVRNEGSKYTLIGSAGRLDYTKNIDKGLKAYEKLLEQHPEWRNQVTLVQIASPSRGSIKAYQDTRAKVEELVEKINTTYGSSDRKPVLHIPDVLPHDAMGDFFRALKVGAVIPKKDGMNLVAKEFLAAQNREDPGVLVLSSGAGASEQLTKAVIVDPDDTDAMAEAFNTALTMPLEVRRTCHEALLNNVKTEDLQWWRDSYLDALKGTKNTTPQ